MNVKQRRTSRQFFCQMRSVLCGTSCPNLMTTINAKPITVLTAHMPSHTAMLGVHGAFGVVVTRLLDADGGIHVVAGELQGAGPLRLHHVFNAVHGAAQRV